MSYTYPSQIPSGVNIVPEISGINQIGSASYPMQALYGQTILTSVRIITSSQTLSQFDHTILTNQAGAIQLNIPLCPAGKVYTIIDISNGALTNPITLSGIGASINGALTSTIGTNRSSTTIYSDGTNYYKATSIL